jgi:hypothetical protein
VNWIYKYLNCLACLAVLTNAWDITIDGDTLRIMLEVINNGPAANEDRRLQVRVE